MKQVTEVRVLDGTRLALGFDTGEVREVDIANLVEPFGVFERIHDPAFFRLVRLNPELGTIVWPNGADLCPDVLYEKSVPSKKSSAA